MKKSLKGFTPKLRVSSDTMIKFGLFVAVAVAVYMWGASYVVPYNQLYQPYLIGAVGVQLISGMCMFVAFLLLKQIRRRHAKLDGHDWFNVAVYASLGLTGLIGLASTLVIFGLQPAHSAQTGFGRITAVDSYVKDGQLTLTILLATGAVWFRELSAAWRSLLMRRVMRATNRQHKQFARQEQKQLKAATKAAAKSAKQSPEPVLQPAMYEESYAPQPNASWLEDFQPSS